MKCLNNDKASITRLSSGMPSGLARNWLQCTWQFCESASSAVHWTCLLSMPFTTWSCSCCASFLKATWFGSWEKSFLSWKSVLCAAMWNQSWTGRNIMCFSAYSALCKLWFGQWKWRNFMERSLSPLRPWCLITSTKLRSRSSLSRKDSSLGFSEKWVTDACMYHVVEASFIFRLEITGI